MITQECINASLVDSNSIVVEVLPHNYVISSDGIYSDSFNGTTPQWLLDAISGVLNNGTGSMASVIGDIQAYMGTLALGINQNSTSIQNATLSLNSLQSSVVSRLDGNDAAILRIDTTKVTAAEASAISVAALQSTFGSNATSFVTNILTTYANANLATAASVELLVAEYNGLSVSITSVEEVFAGVYQQWDGVGAPMIGMFKFVGEIQYQYLGGMLGENNDGWVRTDASAGTAVSALSSTVDTLTNDVGISISNLQSQIDGSISTYFYSYSPSLINVPASLWTTNTIKANHVGDLFYDRTTGYGYRFAYEDIIDTPDMGVIYSWIRITDVDVTAALANASTAQATADGKRTVFYRNTTPTPMIESGITIPIEIGDLWVNSDTNVTKVAVVISPSIIWGDITNTSTENALLALTDLEEARDGNVVVYYLTTTGAATGMTYGDYLVDIDSWDGSNYIVYRYQNATGGSSGTLAWYANIGETAKSLSAGYRAQVLAGTAQSTADGKIKTWYQISAPTGLASNDIGDIWIDTANANKLQVWSGAAWVDQTSTQGTQVAADIVVANGLLADIASDSKLTPVEKSSVKLQWDAIVSEYTAINDRATATGIQYVAYTTTYNALSTYITPLLSSLTITSDIVGATFRTKFSDYFSAKLTLLNLLDATDSRLGALFNANEATPPTATGIGDIWVVTDRWYTASTGTTVGTTSTAYGRSTKRWNGTAWVILSNGSTEIAGVTWAAGASKLITDPSGNVTGWSFGDGSEVQSQFKVFADTFIIQGATAPIAYDNSAIRLPQTYEQISAPTTGMLVGDTWIDTDDSYKAYTYTSTGWKANPASKVFRQATQPAVGISTNDIWYDTDDNNKPYYFDGSSWITIRDGTIAIAQATADAKTTLAAVQAQGYIVPSEVANAINTNSVTVSGSKITAGSIQALQIAANTVTLDKLTSSSTNSSVTGGTFALGAGANVAGFGGIGVFESNTASKFGLIGTANNGNCGIAAGSSTTQFALGAWNSTTSAYTTHNTVAMLASNTIAGDFRNNNSGKVIQLATPTYAYLTGGGASGSFTGGHDALVENTSIPVQGDIVVITGIASKKYFYDTSPTVKLCYTYKAKNVYGVFAQRVSDDHEYPSIVNADGTIDLEYTTLLSTHYGAVINAIGEGQINVCSEGGNIEAGDYICSSNIPGKGMKQDDDILHNYTVAKAMESVNWNIEPSNTKMIACTYHCG